MVRGDTNHGGGNKRQKQHNDMQLIETLNQINPTNIEVEEKFKKLSLDYSNAIDHLNRNKFKLTNTDRMSMSLINQLVYDTNILKVGIGPISFSHPFHDNGNFIFAEISEQYFVGVENESNYICLFETDNLELVSVIADSDATFIEALPLIHQIDIDFIYRGIVLNSEKIEELSRVLKVERGNAFVELLSERYV